MTPPEPKNPLHHVRPSDVYGVARLAVEATRGVAEITEGMHRAVLNTVGFPGGARPGRTGGFTGLVYQGVHGVTAWADRVLKKAQPLVVSDGDARPGTPRRDVVLAAVNGVVGDRLAAGTNPLAIPMSMRYRGEDLDVRSWLPGATGKVVVLIHGLCMTDLHWHPRTGVGHGDALASTLGYTPVYLRYNSGLPTAQNGRELAARLERLVTHWPIPVEEVSVVAHSMGGLLARSALFYAEQESLRWPGHLRSIVFLGTPHHGAPLEQAGHWVDQMLGRTPYTAPWARIGQLRSAGITDLRYGRVADEEVPGRVVPLPAGVAFHSIAATTAERRGLLADRLIGDGLVPVHSALGLHEDPRRALDFAEASRCIAYRTNHLRLLRSPDVARQIIRWLS